MTGWRRAGCECCESGGCAIDSTMGAGVGASWCCSSCGGWYPDSTSAECIDVNFYLPEMTWYQICDGEPVKFLVREEWDTTVRLESKHLSTNDAIRCSFLTPAVLAVPDWPLMVLYDCDGVCTHSYSKNQQFQGRLQSSGGLPSDPSTLLGRPWEIQTPCDPADDYCSGVVFAWRMVWECRNDCEGGGGECVTPVGNHLITEEGGISYYNNAVTDCDSSVAWLGKYASGTPDTYGTMFKSCSLGVDEYCGGATEYAKDWSDGGDSVNELPLLDCTDDYRACTSPVPFIIKIEPGSWC